MGRAVFNGPAGTFKGGTAEWAVGDMGLELGTLVLLEDKGQHLDRNVTWGGGMSVIRENVLESWHKH